MVKPSLNQEFIEERQQRVYTLYRSGLTQTSIAKVLSINLSIVSSDIHAYANKMAASLKATTNQLKIIQADRLDYLGEKIAQKVKDGDLKAIQLALNISVVKSKLLGLDNAESIQAESFPVEINDLDIAVNSDNPDFENAIKLSDLDDTTLRELYFKKLQEASI